MEGCECIESAAARRRIPRLLAGPRHRLDRRHPRCLGWNGPAPIGPGTKAIEGGAGVNDVLDARIRELMADVVEQSPPPPQFPDQRVACLRRANRHPIGTGVAWAAALLALVATIWMLTANRPGPDVADPTAVTIEFTMISPALPERLRSAVLAIPGVADATYTITQHHPSSSPSPRVVAVPRGGPPPVYQPRPGPEPRFDPSTLGSEAPFISAGSPTEALSLARWGVSCPSPAPPVLGTTALVLHIGHLATEEVVFVSDGAPPCLVVESPAMVEAGSFDFSRYPVFGIVSARASSFEAGLVSARVPSETSV